MNKEGFFMLFLVIITYIFGFVLLVNAGVLSKSLGIWLSVLYGIFGFIICFVIYCMVEE